MASLLTLVSYIMPKWFINSGLEGWGVDFAFQERYVHLAMGEWPENKPSSSFILLRYLKCFSPGGKESVSGLS